MRGGTASGPPGAAPAQAEGARPGEGARAGPVGRAAAAASQRPEAGRDGLARRGGGPGHCRLSSPAHSHSVAPRGRHGSRARPPGAHTCLSGAASRGPGGLLGAGECGRRPGTSARAPGQLGIGRSWTKGRVRAGWGDCGCWRHRRSRFGHCRVSRAGTGVLQGIWVDVVSQVELRSWTTAARRVQRASRHQASFPAASNTRSP